MKDDAFSPELEKLSMQLADAQQQINSLKIKVRTEELKAKISSEYSNYALWEYDILEDVMYQYKKLKGRYENNLDPIISFRDTVLGWGMIYADDIPEFNRFCDALKRGDKEVGCEVRAINDEMSFAWYKYEGKTICDDSGKPVRVVGRTLDITEKKGGVGEKSGSRRDTLTGTYTPEAFCEEYTERTTGQQRYTYSALYLVNISALGKIAGQYGADHADYVCKTVAKILLDISACRHDSCVGRLDDGQFGFFTRFTDIASLNELAKQIIHNISSYSFEQDTTVTVCVGITVVRNAKPYGDAYNEASAALRAAEMKGSSTYEYYSPTMNMDLVLKQAEQADNYELDARGGLNAEESAIYTLITLAFIDKESRSSIMEKALRALAELIGAERYMVTVMNPTRGTKIYSLNADGTPSPEQDISADIPENELCKMSLSGIIALDKSVDGGAAKGFAITGNNARTAFVIPMKNKNGLFGWLSFSSSGILRSNPRMLKLVSTALNKMYIAYEEDTREKEARQFSDSVVYNLGVMGYSIIPGTFEVDRVGTNCDVHLGLKKGDICYKKLYGRDKPCRDCPAVHISKSGEMSYTTAFYTEIGHKWLNVTASVEENADGDRRYLISSADITNCLGMIKNYDNLTGLMTFDMFAAEAMRLTMKNTQEYHIAVINVAGFRRINEDNGYEFGNSILIAVSDILERSIGAGELVGRSEGSRFLALFRNRNGAELEVRLNQLMASIQKQVFEKCAKQIYLLVGVYEMGENGVSVMTAIDRAITAQKTVKDKTYFQENLIGQYNQELREELKNRRYIEAHMLDALENDEFKVYYQPKVSIRTGKIVGAEALVRWIRGDGEIVSPAKFVPIFEANGFIADMDFAIYRHVIADIKRWLRNGLDVPLISLNVSRHHLRDDSFSDKLNALVDSLGIPHTLVELEITESLLTENLEKLVEIMTKLKSLGFRISIDDFGSGYSSLNLITLLPFDTLKIDGGFFLKNDLTERNRKVISSVVTLAKSLNLETVSEGVEMQEQVDFLRDLGCDMIQGYFYYKPMPGAEFEKLLNHAEYGDPSNEK